MSSTEKGNSAKSQTPITSNANLHEHNSKKWIVTVPINVVPGINLREKSVCLQTMLVNYVGFLGARPNLKKRCLDVAFDNQQNLLAMISEVIFLNNTKFTPITTDRSSEVGHTIKAMDIPLYVKSPVVYEFFNKMGKSIDFQ